MLLGWLTLRKFCKGKGHTPLRRPFRRRARVFLVPKSYFGSRHNLQISPPFLTLMPKNKRYVWI